MHSRRLNSSDSSDFLRLRLFGLCESPSAFGSSYEEEKDRTIEQIESHLTGSVERVFFGHFQDQELIGVVGVGREQGVKERHIAFVRSMYVTPEFRGNGIGRSLLNAALQQAFAWPGVEQVTLAVTASNASAVNLYRGTGFVEAGCMPRALRIGSEYFAELNMVHIR